ncbi:winged helix-turn-helix transcriptional regulator [Pseudovibrio japonicus]|nr:helix-turn-helix domain-containing protein [Pseudovibrio japonicus]
MSNIPKPGEPVRGSRSGAPIMALFDLFGRRWAMGVLWVTCENGPLTFRDLQAKCEGISPAVLNSRLKDLRDAQFIHRVDEGYAATPLGEKTYRQLVPLGALAKEWAKVIEVSE